VIADDAALIREGVARVLMEGGLDVVDQVSDADALLRSVRDERPDVALVDIRTAKDDATKVAAYKKIAEEVNALARDLHTQFAKPDLDAATRRALVFAVGSVAGRLRAAGERYEPRHDGKAAAGPRPFRASQGRDRSRHRL
jgi:CheY-like chemotaxis protein